MAVIARRADVRQGDGDAPEPVPTSTMRGCENCGGQLDNFLDQVLGFGAGNQHIGRDAKGQAVELGFAGDVLDGLARLGAARAARRSDAAWSPASSFVGCAISQARFVSCSRMCSSKVSASRRARSGCGPARAAALAPCERCAERCQALRPPGWHRPSTARPGSG